MTKHSATELLQMSRAIVESSNRTAAIARELLKSSQARLERRRAVKAVHDLQQRPAT